MPPQTDMSDLTTTAPAGAAPAAAPSAAPDTSDLTTTPPTTTENTPPAPERGFMSNIVGGFLRGAAKDVVGAGNAASEGVARVEGKPNWRDYGSGTMADNAEKPSIARGVGELGENMAEFSLGGEVLDALKGLEFLNGTAKAAKLTELATKYPMVGRMLAMSKEYPIIGKIMAESAKAAAIGGAQGAVKGASEGRAEQGAVEGAEGGAAGAAIGETAGAVAQEIGKTMGIGTTAIEDATRGAKPNKRNLRFAEDFQRAAPYMDAENSADQAKSVEDWADHADAARQKLWTQQIQPIIDRHAHVPLSGIAIRDSISDQIPRTWFKYHPERAAQVTQLANKFMPGQVFALTVGDAEDELEQINADLAATGYWSKLPNERAALLKSDPTILGYKASADAIREELYNRLGILEPADAPKIQDLKKDYGALRNVGNEIRGQVNVAGRQAPISLKQTIGIATGLGQGTPLGAVVAAIPFADKVANSPEQLISRGVQKAARPGEEGIVSKGVQAAGRGAKAAAPAVGAAAGEARAEEQGHRITFQASDGTMHSVPADQIHQALQIDPHLTIVNQ